MIPQANPEPQVQLIDPSWTLKGSPDEMYFQHDQDIPSNFLSRISDVRTDTAHAHASNFMEVAEIPVAVVEKWEKEGFDIYKETAKSIVKRLSAENLGAFISTSKRI